MGASSQAILPELNPDLLGEKSSKYVRFKPIIRSCTHKNTEVNYKYYDDVQMLLDKVNGARIIFVF